MLFASPPVQVDLLHAFRAQIPKIHRVSKVPVLLPAKLPLGAKFRVYSTGGPNKRGWDLELAAARNCGGATACFVASFDAKRAAKLPRKATFRLSTGDPAVFHGVSCGASCAPASLWFTHGGVLYSWQFKSAATTKAAMSRLATQAIKAGGR